MSDYLTDWRLWLWMGRIAGLAAIIKTGAEGHIAWHAFFACAASFVLSDYFQRRARP
jgi:hypothetical protein